MTWFKVDDGFADHPKVDALLEGKHGEAALALWTLAGSWCSKHLTDGHVPAGRVRRFGVRHADSAAAELVRVGLWVVVHDGFQFHQWTDHQPSRESVVAERDRKARNKRDSRAKAKSGDQASASPAESPHLSPVTESDVTGDKPVSHHGHAGAFPTRPDPTRPDHDRKRGGGTEVARATADALGHAATPSIEPFDSSPASLVEVVWSQELWRRTEGRGGHVPRAGDAQHLRAIADAAQRCRGHVPLREFVAGWARTWFGQRRSERVRLEWWAEWCVEQAASVPVGHRLPSPAEYAEAAEESLDDLLAARAQGGLHG